MYGNSVKHTWAAAQRTPTDTDRSPREDQELEVIERNGGKDGARTGDLRRDRPKSKDSIEKTFLYPSIAYADSPRLLQTCFSIFYSHTH